MQMELPEILNLPPKMLPIIDGINKYKFILLEGGRGSGKSHGVARLLEAIAEKRRVRIVCGRETQNSIEDSVYTILSDLIRDYSLGFEVLSNKIRHPRTGSEFKFRGFREQGSVNIKGLEGVDIVWIDEAQAITQRTLDTLIPTIRKEKSKFIFTMNRFMRDDPVYDFLVNRDDCLHIKINYFDNPFCPLTLKIEAEVCKNKSQKEYAHIWLGEPLSGADDYLFNYDKLWAALGRKPFGETIFRQRVMGIDFAAQGNDLCVATILDRVSGQHFQVTKRIAWDEPDAMVSVGKIVNLIGENKPDVTILDVGGMGHAVWNRLQEVGMDVKRFDGASTQLVDTKHYVNARANGYYLLREWFDSGFLCVTEGDKDLISQLEKIKIKFRSDGRRILQAKHDMKKELGFSPDDADSLMMAVWASHHYLGEASNPLPSNSGGLRRVSQSRRHASSNRIRRK